MLGPTSMYNKAIKYGRVVERDMTFEPLSSKWKDVPFVTSENGKFMAVSDNANTVAVFDAKTAKMVCEVNGIKGAALALSPLGTYLVVWTRFVKGKGPNMIVYDATSGKETARIFERSFSRQNWPSLRWNKDETVAAKCVTNQVQFFDGHPFTGKTRSAIHVPGVSAFAMSDSTPMRVATFTPERKGTSASVAVYLYPDAATPAPSSSDVSTGEKKRKPKPINAKSFFKAQDATMSFSKSGSYVICRTSTDIDRSGGSYYGAIFAYLLSCRGRGVEDSCALPEHCQTVAWSTVDDEFVAVTGKMPSTAALYNFRGNKVQDLGRVARNTVSWSPHGRFFCVAGFGSLQGSMDFYDRTTMKKIGETTAGSPPTWWGWSHDSRCFLTATLFPRMRQGVGFEVYSYRGDILYREESEELTQVSWQSVVPITTYPNRPPSPGRTRAKDISVRKQAKKSKAMSKVAKYRPPGARHRGNAVSDMMNKDRLGITPSHKNNTTRTNAYRPPGASRSVPGASTTSRNKKSRRRRKKTASSNGSTSSPPTTPPLPSSEVKPNKPLTAAEKEKEKRKIGKKLRQIEKLKAKSELNEEQKKKVALEASLRKRLNDLSM